MGGKCQGWLEIKRNGLPQDNEINSSKSMAMNDYIIVLTLDP